MLGELQTRQIVSLLADGMAPDQIASSLELDVALVKLVAARHNQGEDRDITDQDLAALRAHAVSLALGAENEAVQAKMTMFLIERDKPKKQNTVINPVVLVNQAIRQANGIFNELSQAYSGGATIDT